VTALSKEKNIIIMCCAVLWHTVPISLQKANTLTFPITPEQKIAIKALPKIKDG